MSEHPANESLAAAIAWLDTDPRDYTDAQNLEHAVRALAWCAVSYLQRDVAYARVMAKEALAFIDDAKKGDL